MEGVFIRPKVRFLSGYLTHFGLVDLITVTLVDEDSFSKVFDVVADAEISAGESVAVGFIAKS